ncbi:DNA helicase MCM8 [Phlebotomus argentipes]|uniref:DNA helicase MCM8 n=1 Tax=Phlebotomus argentipes TaxID=94469 RepID=UPI002892C0A7|nr:DNA helicase MCM8 [Phlebotomus argentipes]
MDAPEAGPSSDSGRTRGGRGSRRGAARGRGDSSNAPSRGRGASRGRPWFRPHFWNSRRNEPAREKPISVPVSLNGGSEEPQVVSSVNRRSVANFAGFRTAEKYPDWKLYLPREAHMEGSQMARKVEAFADHVARNPGVYELETIQQKLNFEVNLEVVQEDSVFKAEWATFGEDLLNDPENTLACLAIAVHHKILKLDGQNSAFQRTIRPKIVGFGPIIHMKTLKVSTCGKMISIKGTVTRLGSAEIICTWMAFECPECGSAQVVRQPDGKFLVPKSCTGKGMCRNTSNFESLLTSHFTRSESVQTILLEESINERGGDAQRAPRSIEIELTNDMVDSVCPGDDVTITGVLKLRSGDEHQKDKAQSFVSYIRAVNLISNSGPVMKKTLEFTQKSLRAIELIRSDPFPLRLLVHSLAPSVRGYEMVKAALLLGLFSGNLSDNSSFRSEVHILIVGDPGLGKSCILKGCAAAAPRGIFTSCSSSSRTGLTATVKTEKGEGATLEAGALVLADQGVCCIDEFDKLASNHASMLEVMEQQSVSVAKAGVVCTLPARTTILAAGNPISGHYDHSKTVSENLKLHPAVLSRFDIVFILMDQRGKDFTLFSQSGQSFDASMPLHKRLELRPGEHLDALPHVLFQKYVAYAQKIGKVRLTPEAGNLLQSFWQELRRIRLGTQCIPVTIRQMEAMVRMTMARARVDLSAEATVDHAKDVIEMMKFSIIDVLSPDGGSTIDVERGINGSGMSKASQVRKFFAEIQTRSVQKRTHDFHMDELKFAANKLGMANILRDMLESLNTQGFILNCGNGFYRLL